MAGGAPWQKRRQRQPTPAAGARRIQPAPLPSCGVAVVAAQQAAPGGMEGEGLLAVEASSKTPGGGDVGVRPTRGTAPHPARVGTLAGLDTHGGEGEGDAGK